MAQDHQTTSAAKDLGGACLPSIFLAMLGSWFRVQGLGERFRVQCLGLGV